MYLPSSKAEWAYKLGATFPYQQDWIKDEHKYKLCVKARQIGMTTAIAINGLLNAILNDEYVLLFVSPSERQSLRLMSYFYKALDKLERFMKQEFKITNKRKDYCKFEHYSEVCSIPNNPNTIQGFDANEVVIDEAGLFKGDEGQEILEATMGSLGAKGGRLAISGKPHGRRKFFWEFYEGAKLGQKGNHFINHVYELPWTARGDLDPIYKQSVEEQRDILLSRGMRTAWEETYECAFIDETICMFPYDILEACVDKNLELVRGDAPYQTNNPLYMGIDFGRAVHKTSIYVVEKVANRYEVRMFKDTRAEYYRQFDTILKLNKNLRPSAIYLDKSGPGGPMYDFLFKRLGNKVVPFNFTNQEKERLLIDLRNILADRRIRIPDDDDLLDELHSIDKTVTDRGNVQYIAPEKRGSHADKAFALALAVNQTGAEDFKFEIVDGERGGDWLNEE